MPNSRHERARGGSSGLCGCSFHRKNTQSQMGQVREEPYCVLRGQGVLFQGYRRFFEGRLISGFFLFVWVGIEG